MRRLRSWSTQPVPVKLPFVARHTYFITNIHELNNPQEFNFPQDHRNMNKIYGFEALITKPLGRSIQQHRANMPDRFGGVQPLRTYIHTILNAMATEDAERIIQLGQPPLCCRIAAVRQKAVGLQ